ncbi:MAG: hypothetical protein DME13_28180, partial [Candidatus Rokuibacteriota bacterium]
MRAIRNMALTANRFSGERVRRGRIKRYIVASLVAASVLVLSGVARANVATGSYTTTASPAAQSVTVGFQPDVVIVKGGSQTMVIRT